MLDAAPRADATSPAIWFFLPLRRAVYDVATRCRASARATRRCLTLRRARHHVAGFHDAYFRPRFLMPLLMPCFLMLRRRFR